MAMSWKDVLLFFLVVGALVLGCLARNFLGEVLFVLRHLIAASAVYLTGFLHFVVALVR